MQSKRNAPHTDAGVLTHADPVVLFTRPATCWLVPLPSMSSLPAWVQHGTCSEPKAEIEYFMRLESTHISFFHVHARLFSSKPVSHFWHFWHFWQT